MNEYVCINISSTIPINLVRGGGQETFLIYALGILGNNLGNN